MTNDEIASFFENHGWRRVNDNDSKAPTIDALYSAFKSRIEQEAALRLFPNEGTK